MSIPVARRNLIHNIPGRAAHHPPAISYAAARSDPTTVSEFMKRFFHLTAFITLLSFPLFNLRAEDTASAFTLPSSEPLTVLLLPEGFKQSDVSVAISKALLEEQWENLGWESNITTATSLQSRVNLKVFAVTNASDVKLYVSYSSEKNVPDDKCKKVALRQLRFLERTIATKLKLIFRQAKGDETVDRATVD